MTNSSAKHHLGPFQWLSPTSILGKGVFGREWRLRVVRPLAFNVAVVEEDHLIVSSASSSNIYVAKRVPYSGTEELALLQLEAETWKKLSEASNPLNKTGHTVPYDIVRFVDYMVFSDKTQPAVVFLMQYLKKSYIPEAVSARSMLRYLARLTAALEAFAQLEISCHGHISHSTILLDEHGHPKLAGFGLTRAKKEGSLTDDLKALAKVAEDAVQTSRKGVTSKLQRVIDLMRLDKPDLVTVRYEIAAARGMLPEVHAASKPEVERNRELVLNADTNASENDSLIPNRKKKKEKKPKKKADGSKRSSPENSERPESASIEETSPLELRLNTNHQTADIPRGNALPDKEQVRDRAVHERDDSPGAEGVSGDSSSVSGRLHRETQLMISDVSPYSHGDTDAVKAVVMVLTDGQLDVPPYALYEWMLEEVKLRTSALSDTFILLYKRPIRKNPIIAFKILALIHALVCEKSEEVMEFIRGQYNFLGWVAKYWKPQWIHAKNPAKAHPQTFCFLEGEISLYAELLRSGANINPESLLNLIRLLLHAQDECKVLKMVAVPFLLRDIEGTSLMEDAFALVKAHPGRMEILDPRLLEKFDLLRIVNRNRGKVKPSKQKKQGKRDQSKDRSSKEIVSREQNGLTQGEAVEHEPEEDHAAELEQSNGQREVSIPSNDLEKVPNSSETAESSSETEHNILSFVKSKLAKIERAGGGEDKEEAGEPSNTNKVKAKPKSKSKEKKSKKSRTSDIVKEILAREREYKTTDDESDDSEDLKDSEETDAEAKSSSSEEENISSRKSKETSKSKKSASKSKSKSSKSKAKEPGKVERESRDFVIPNGGASASRMDEDVRYSEREGYSESSRLREKDISFDRTDERKKNSKKDREKRARKNGNVVVSSELKAAIADRRKTPRMNPSIEVMPHEVVFGPQIGAGGFGVVYKGRFRGRVAAIKKIHSYALINPTAVSEFQSEVAVLCNLKHKNILEFLGACTKPPNLMIITAFMENGTLFDLLHQSQMKVTWSMRRKFALDICNGMKYLHDCKLLHRDLKSSNLMLDHDFTCRIGDFGLTRISSAAGAAPMTGQCGTFQYMAPEVLGNQPYSEKADVFSFGILLWEMVDRRLPYFGMKPMQVGLAVLNTGLRPTIPPNCPRPLAWLMQRCWSQDPVKRPSFGEISKILEEMPE